MKTMYCNSCGQPSSNGAVFCSSCAARLSPAAGEIGEAHKRPAVAGLASAASVGGAFEQTVGGPAVPESAEAFHRVEPTMSSMPTAVTSRSFRPSASSECGFDEEAWRRVIGNNADYYLPRFNRLAASGPAPSWHWAAFLVTWWWMLYRKMWGLSFIYLFSALLLSCVLRWIGRSLNVGEAVADVLSYADMAALWIVPPLFANQWYYSRCRALMVEAAGRARNRDEYLGFLSAKGGTGAGAWLGAAFMILLTIIFVLGAVALPVFQDYMKRATMRQVMSTGRAASLAVPGQPRCTLNCEQSPCEYTAALRKNLAGGR
jgi:hypothetical protein